MSMLGAGALLKLLGSGIRAIAGPSKPAATDTTSFEELLKRARENDTPSGSPVRVAGGSGVTLNENQLARVAAAADKAEAAGAARALVLIDGQALMLDVGVRTITGRASLEGTNVHAGFDAVISVESEGSAATSDDLLKALGGVKAAA